MDDNSRVGGTNPPVVPGSKSWGTSSLIVLVVQWLSVGLMIERSLVWLPAGALSSQLGQISLPSLRGR